MNLNDLSQNVSSNMNVGFVVIDYIQLMNSLFFLNLEIPNETTFKHELTWLTISSHNYIILIKYHAHTVYKILDRNMKIYQ